MWRMCFWPRFCRRLADGVRVSTAKMISRTARAVPRPERHPGLVSRGHSSRRVTAQSTGTSPDIRTGGDTLRAPKHPGAVSIASPRDVRKRLIRLQLQQHGFGNAQCLLVWLSRRPMYFGNGDCRPAREALNAESRLSALLQASEHIQPPPRSPAREARCKATLADSRPTGPAKRRQTPRARSRGTGGRGRSRIWLGLACSHARCLERENRGCVCGPHGLARRRLRSSESRPAVGLWTGKS